MASFQAGAAAVSAALVCATKVPGLVFGGSFILLFALFLLRMRMWKRFWIVATVFVATSFPAFAIQYIHNLHQYGALFAESYSGNRAAAPPAQAAGPSEARLCQAPTMFSSYCFLSQAEGSGRITTKAITGYGSRSLFFLWSP